jgi:hypothetical protein
VDPIERLRQRGEVMAQTGIAMQRLAEAADPLYKSLDQNQKRRFAMLARIGRPGMGGPGMGGGFRGPDGARGFDRGPRRMEFDGDFRRGPGDRLGDRFGSDSDGARRDGFRGRGRDGGLEGAARRGMPGEEDL